MKELSAAKTTSIIRMYFTGYTYDEITVKNNVSKGTIFNVIAEIKAGLFPEGADLGEDIDLLREAAIASHGHPILSEADDPVKLTAVTPGLRIEEQKAQDGDGAQLGDDLAGCKGECDTANPALQKRPPAIGNQVDLLTIWPGVKRRCFCPGLHTISHPSMADGIHTRRHKAFGSETRFKRRLQQYCALCRESPGRFTRLLASSPWRPKMSKWPVRSRPFCRDARGPPVIDTSCGRAVSATCIAESEGMIAASVFLASKIADKCEITPP